jgi:hypothetical protein
MPRTTGACSHEQNCCLKCAHNPYLENIGKTAKSNRPIIALATDCRRLQAHFAVVNGKIKWAREIAQLTTHKVPRLRAVPRPGWRVSRADRRHAPASPCALDGACSGRQVSNPHQRQRRRLGLARRPSRSTPKNRTWHTSTRENRASRVVRQHAPEIGTHSSPRFRPAHLVAHHPTAKLLKSLVSKPRRSADAIRRAG